MIIDSHCHAWAKWPYQPEVPDPDSRGVVEQLLFEMDRCGVDQAAIVCARIDHNPDNNDYVAECVQRYPGRLYQIADVDCVWMESYHQPGADQRLREAAKKYNLKAFTHYVRSDYDWFESADGLAFFQAAADLNLIVSIAIAPDGQAPLRKLAARFPETPFLCHHMAQPKAAERPPYPVLDNILRSADLPNIYIKLSGYHYASQVPWDYPQSDCGRIVRALYQAYGATRLCWGTDYPVVRAFMTYRHALEAFRTHCTFVPDADKALILGDNLYGLLQKAGR